MTGARSFRREVQAEWLAVWPIWTLVGFVGLEAARLLPAGYARAAVAAPILLLVPGSLTLGAVFSGRRRPQAAVFVCYAILLSALWSVFVSLALYALSIRISASSTYRGLLLVSIVVAVVAQARLLLGRPGRGRRAVHKREAPDPDLSEDEVVRPGTSAAVRAKGRHAVLAVVAGTSLLAGGAYAYEHLPQPAPTGYTWMAWTGPHVNGDIAIGSAGTELSFQIVHRQSGTTAFRLSATWAGAPPHLLAKSLILRIGPDKTFKGRLFVPPLPDGCTYRLVVALTDVRRISPPIHKTGIWSINADVHDPVKSSKKCH
jgi:hypothetical protein